MYRIELNTVSRCGITCEVLMRSDNIQTLIHAIAQIAWEECNYFLRQNCYIVRQDDNSQIVAILYYADSGDDRPDLHVQYVDGNNQYYKVVADDVTGEYYGKLVV